MIAKTCTSQYDSNDWRFGENRVLQKKAYLQNALHFIPSMEAIESQKAVARMVRLLDHEDSGAVGKGIPSWKKKSLPPLFFVII